MKPESETAVTRNAQRLLHDAELLLANKRAASALPMAILAIEEVGKCILLRWRREAPDSFENKKFPARHTDKQSAFLAMHVARVQKRALTEICKAFGEADWQRASGDSDWDKAQDFLVAAFQIMQHDPIPERKQLALDTVNAISEHARQAVLHDSIACMLSLAKKGELDRLKQSGFYVDVNAKGAVTVDPDNANHKMAELFVELARVAVAELDTPEAALSATQKFIDMYKTLPTADVLPETFTAFDWKSLIERIA